MDNFDDLKIWDLLFQTLGESQDHREAGETIQKAEPDYLAALEQLTEAQREQVERYISACEAQSDIMILHAYRLGYRKGRLDPFVIKT